ncbi:MAG: hypothetical protein H6695_00455 [Deferribacteres bacterium]|nr:hypothetical protein [candidate division KSB1 bacterium]MCB9508620.1 hypothetical protein [Deferribacteres bacterium]
MFNIIKTTIKLLYHLQLDLHFLRVCRLYRRNSDSRIFLYEPPFSNKLLASKQHSLAPVVLFHVLLVLRMLVGVRLQIIRHLQNAYAVLKNSHIKTISKILKKLNLHAFKRHFFNQSTEAHWNAEIPKTNNAWYHVLLSSYSASNKIGIARSGYLGTLPTGLRHKLRAS